MKKNYIFQILMVVLGLFISFSGMGQSGMAGQPGPSNRGSGNQEKAGRTNVHPISKITRHDISQPAGWTTGKETPLKSQHIDNRGTEFWLLMERNGDLDTDLQQFLDITSDVSTTGTVEIPGLSFSQSFSVHPDSVTRIELPYYIAIEGSETVESKGIHVIAQQEVTVYGVSLMPYSSDAYLGLPLDILATQYLIMSYPNLTWWSGSPSISNISQLAIVSPYDNVTVTITPASDTYNNNPAGVPFQVVLNQGETYQVMGQATFDPADDLTGTLVQSSLPVAVFSGNSCTSVPTNIRACDHIIEQIPPIFTWGKSFVTYPLQGRENGDTWRVLSSSNNTDLFFNDSLVATLQFGDFYETVLTGPMHITASNPVLVMQFANGDDWDPGLSSNGDPFMMLVPPFEQFMNNYTFSTCGGYPYHYMTVTTATNGIPGLLLDGAPVPASLFNTIGITGFSGAGISLGLGSHTIKNTNGIPFGIYVYGFGGYDSYGYPGGLSLEYINTGSAPVIERTPATVNLEHSGQPENAALTIAVVITDPEAPLVQNATLFYKRPSEGSYTGINMVKGANDTWSASIPATQVLQPGIYYYIYASDGQLSSTSPAIDPSNNPYSIAVLPNSLPMIVHNAITTAPFNQALLISAQVTDNTNSVASVQLFYRKMGENPVYVAQNMSLQSGNTYKGTIPQNYLTDQGTEYYIKATDDLSTSSTYYTADYPVQVNKPIGINDPENPQMRHFAIFPNPTNGRVNVVIRPETDADVILEVVNLQGVNLTTLVNQHIAPGNFEFTTDLQDLHQGCYFLVLHMNGEKETLRLLILNPKR